MEKSRQHEYAPRGMGEDNFFIEYEDILRGSGWEPAMQ